MSTTTEHLKALLVDDGREFAMVRKADLAALMHVANAYPDGKFVDLVGSIQRRADSAEYACKGLARMALKSAAIERKHGEERRRYMANNKALQARVTQLEQEGVDDALLALSLTCEVVPLRHAVSAAIRKAPATCRLLGLIK